MHLVPTQDEVIQLLRSTGALREGHFLYPNGMHSNQYLQVPLAFRYYQHAKTLSVGLSRLLRANPEIRAMIPELSIVTPANGGLPVAFGVCEALRAKQVYWAEKENENQALRFRQFLEQHPGEKVVIVDDILRTGKKLLELKTLLESNGAQVVAVAVIVYQPSPEMPDFSPLPLYYLAQLEPLYMSEGPLCDISHPNAEPTKVWI